MALFSGLWSHREIATINTLGFEQTGSQLADDIFKYINVYFQVSVKSVWKALIKKMAFIQIKVIWSDLE